MPLEKVGDAQAAPTPAGLWADPGDPDDCPLPPDLTCSNDVSPAIASVPVRRALLVLAVLLGALAPLSPSVHAMRAIQTSVVTVVTICAFLRWRRTRTLSWSLLSGGTALWLGALVGGWYSVAVDSAGWHVAARWLFVAGAVVGLGGLARLLSAGDLRRNWIQALDATVVAASATMVLATWLGDSIDLDAIASTMQLPLLGPSVTLAMASFTLTAAISQPDRMLPRWFTAGLWVSLGGDLLQLVQTGHSLSATETAYAPLLASGSVLLLIGLLGSDAPGVPRSPAAPARRRLFAALVAFSLAVAVGDMILNHAVRPVVIAAGVVMTLGETAALLLALTDLGDKEAAARSAMRDLATSERRFHLAIEAAPVGIGVARQDGTIVLANLALIELLGEPREEILGRRWQEFVDQSERIELPSLATEPSALAVRRFLRPPGELRMVEVFTRRFPAPDGEELWLGIAQDVTARVQAMEQLEHLADHDDLTGLPNRRAFMRALQRHLDSGGGGVLSVCDLDQFKYVNDTLGHTAGDRLLGLLAERITVLRTHGCAISRIGGDEFCVLVPEEVPAPLDLVASAFGQPFDLGEGEVLHATASVGGTVVREGADPERLLAEADAAMYRAKAGGPGRRAMYTPGTGRVMREQWRTTAGLYRALHHDELEVWFQPLARADDGTVVALESLLRWRDPQRGLLTPSDFIDVAEQGGLIAGIGELVIHRAMEAACAPEWSSAGARVSVNVSAVQVADAGFASTVDRALSSTGMDPDRLWLEITESALLNDERAARRTCHALRDLGTHLSIDDFGTGYGSLSYLLDFPVEAIKIDRSFVSGITRVADEPYVVRADDPPPLARGEAIIAALVELTARLQLGCVAEGVETARQLDRLRRLGCPMVQGYLVGPPLPEPRFVVAADFPSESRVRTQH